MILRIHNGQEKAEQSLYLFIAGLLLQPIYIDLMATLSEVTGFDTKITTYICYGALWILLIAAASTILRTITHKVVLGVLMTILIACSQYLFFPESYKFIGITDPMSIIAFSPTTLLTVAPYILVGLAVADTDKLMKPLHTVARIGIVMGALSYVIAIAEGHEINYDDMSNAYALCLVTCVLVIDTQKGDLGYILLGIFSMFIAGTRGPFVGVITAFLLKNLILSQSQRKRILSVLSSIIVIILLFTDIPLRIIEGIAGILEKFGVTGLRIADYAREGILMDASGRNEITGALMEKVWESPVWGYGLGADRGFSADGSYAHNLFVELWVSFGLIAGSAIALGILYWIVRAMMVKNIALQKITMIYSSVVVIKLMFSGSFLHEKELFIMLGICMAGCSALAKSKNKENIESQNKESI